MRRPPLRWRTRGIGCGGWSQPRRCSGSGCCWRRTDLFLRVGDTLAGASKNPRDSAGKSSWKIKKEQKPLKRHPAPYVSYSLYPDVGRERVRDGSIIPFVPPILQQPFQLLFLSFPRLFSLSFHPTNEIFMGSPSFFLLLLSPSIPGPLSSLSGRNTDLPLTRSTQLLLSLSLSLLLFSHFWAVGGKKGEKVAGREKGGEWVK